MSYMKVAATSTLAKALNNNRSTSGSIAKISYRTTDIDHYVWFIDVNYYLHNVDYLASTGKMRFIQVDYKPECYAMSRYLTTREIDRIFKTEHCTTAEQLIQAILEYIEI